MAHPDATHPKPLAGEATGCLAGRWPMSLTRLKTLFHGEARAPGGAIGDRFASIYATIGESRSA